MSAKKLFPRARVYGEEVEEKTFMLPPVRASTNIEELLLWEYDNTIGYKVVYTVPPNKEAWITNIHGYLENVAASNMFLYTQSPSDIPAGTLHRMIGITGNVANSNSPLNISYSWPLYLPSGWRLRKFNSANVTNSVLCVSGWQGNMPEGTGINIIV